MGAKMSLEKFILQSNEIREFDDLYTLLEETLVTLCGFDRVIFSLISDHTSISLKAGHGIMRNYPDEWMKHYVQKGYEHIDPVRQFGFRHVGPYIWDSLPLVMNLSSRQSLCMNQCREAGFFNGAAVALRGLPGELAGIGVASSTRSSSETEREICRKLSLFNMIAQQFYAVFCNLHERKHRPTEDPINLTQREMEIIQQLARAKKDDAIACDLNLSKHAVDFHVRNLLKKFNAHNRMAVVLKAINGGVINIDQTTFVSNSYFR